MRILITGGTGFVGSALAHLLGAGGHDVRLLVRTESRTSVLAGLDAELVEGDVLSPSTLAPVMRGIDCVVHTAGMTRADRRRSGLLWRTNVEGTANVLGAALRAEVPRAVYTSSVAALGPARGATALVDERGGAVLPRQSSVYARSKAAAELEARRLADQGLELAIIYPGMVVGPGDWTRSSTSLWLGFVRGALRSFVDGGLGLVDVRDVALAHARAIAADLGQQRLIVSAENRLLGEVAGEVCGLAGVPAPRRVPFAIAYAAATLSDVVVARVRPRAARFGRGQAVDGHQYWFVDNTRSREVLGMRYRPLRDSLLDMLRWALANGQLSASTPELQALASQGAVDLATEMRRCAERLHETASDDVGA